MTREEAIKGLKAFRKEFSGYEPNEEMFDLAIKALEQEPKIKVLERDEVIRKLGEVDVYKASAWITFFKDLDYLGMKICEVEK